MTWQDYFLVLGTLSTFVLTAVELLYIVGIFKDDHAMKLMAEESLKVQRESLEAQREYLALRRKWYASRTKTKEEKKDNDQQRAAGPSDGGTTNIV